ncbi:MAG: molybdate ABC transporter substrate-binding protein [Clostridia bacterium]|jgi:molybdate transport system substrate-binding protein|nr:molybdate ABC transporter substrate-binding protein [Clostridia bacterium]
MTRKLIFLVLTLAIITGLLIAGCTKPGNQAAQIKPTTTLTLSVAASLTDAITEIKELYKKENPTVEIQLNFGSSGALQQQIEQGAPADIFISAASQQMNNLQEKGLLVDETRKDLLVNKIVLITPIGSAIKNFEDLLNPNVKIIALGETETVPAGRYAKGVLESLALWDKLQPKFTFAKDVREVLAFVETGNADAGIVYQTDAQISNKVQIAAVAPEGSHAPIVYPLAVIKDSKNKEAANQFIQFITSAVGKTVFEKYGFTTAF